MGIVLWLAVFYPMQIPSPKKHRMKNAIGRTQRPAHRLLKG